MINPIKPFINGELPMRSPVSGFRRGAPAGIVAWKFHPAEHMGEIYMIAVDPDFQRRGIARALTEHAMKQFREAGMTTAMVETGGDPGHEPARRTYEAAGFQAFPSVRYFRKV